MFFSNASLIEGRPLHYYDRHPKQCEYFPFFRPFECPSRGMERVDLMVPSSPTSSQVRNLTYLLLGFLKKWKYIFFK